MAPATRGRGKVRGGRGRGAAAPRGGGGRDRSAYIGEGENRPPSSAIDQRPASAMVDFNHDDGGLSMQSPVAIYQELRLIPCFRMRRFRKWG